MATLRVSPWEYSEIRKNAYDKTEVEFIDWALGKWPWLNDHLYENIDVVVDWGNGDVPSGETIPAHGYILSFRSLK